MKGLSKGYARGASPSHVWEQSLHMYAGGEVATSTRTSLYSFMPLLRCRYARNATQCEATWACPRVRQRASGQAQERTYISLCAPGVRSATHVTLWHSVCVTQPNPTAA